MSNVIPWPGQVDQDAITINFLERLLPPHGLYCACVKQGKGMREFWRESVEALWTVLREEDRAGHDVYFSLASFSSNSRTIEACAEKRSLELDIDYGSGHARAGYETYDEARSALKAFCIKVGLPVPMVVESGGGFHVHWPFKEAIPTAKWMRYANGLKAACLEHGLRADHSLTTNPVVILRPPGTTNRKLSVARPVKLDPAWLQFPPTDWPDELLQYAADNVVRLRAPALPPKPEFLNDSRYPAEAFPDHRVDIRALSGACGVVRDFQRSGNQFEPTWAQLSNLFHYIEDGERLFHEYSKNDYPNYNHAETQLKWDRASRLTGPPFCKTFEKGTNEHTRAICLKCPLLDVIKTPLQGVENEQLRPSDTSDILPSVPPGVRPVDAKKPPYVEWDRGEKGGILSTYKNTAIAIGKLEPVCTYDSFHMKKFVNEEPLDDTVARVVREQIITRFRFDPKKENVGEALSRECERNAFDPVADYLASLRWDGVGRLDRWFVYYLGADDTELNRAFGRKTLLAAARRVRQRGCKFDYMLILEGPQGVGKSSAWRIMAGDENFSDAQIKWDDPKQQREVLGSWIHEVSELVGLRKADVDAIKSFLSRQVDKGRAAYDRFPTDQPRRGIVVGTINPRPGIGYLTDPTGARRFWPVKVGRIDLEALKQDRDQLWAEAAAIEATGETLELPTHLWAAAADEQDLRRVGDPWVDILSNLVGDRVATMDIMIRDLGMTKDRISSFDAGRVASCMKRLGWDGPKMIRVEGKAVRGYERSV